LRIRHHKHFIIGKIKIEKLFVSALLQLFRKQTWVQDALEHSPKHGECKPGKQ
jgi:hypothetical protein